MNPLYICCFDLHVFIAPRCCTAKFCMRIPIHRWRLLALMGSRFQITKLSPGASNSA